MNRKEDSTAASMLTPAEDELQGTPSPRNPDLSSWTYEIIMVSLSGGIFLAALMFVAVKIIRTRVLHFLRKGEASSPAKDLAADETVVANITVKHKEEKDICTAQVTGPAYVRYVPEKEMPSSEAVTPEGKPDSNMAVSFSFASSITPFDAAPEQ